jgi:hypothetical protein
MNPRPVSKVGKCILIEDMYNENNSQKERNDPSRTLRNECDAGEMLVVNRGDRRFRKGRL